MTRFKILSLLCFALILGGRAEAQVIAVETADQGLYLTVGADKTLYMQHYAGRLTTPEELLVDCDNNTPNVKNVEGEAYPAFGNGQTNEIALIATHADGNLTTLLKYDGHERQELSDNVTLTRIRLRDPLYDFSVTLFYKAYLRENVIESWSEILHGEKRPVKLDRFASTCITLRADEYWLTHFYGAWSSEMQMVEERLRFGIKTIESKKGIRTTQTESPSFVLSLDGKADETRGEAIIGTLAWSSNYKLSFQVDNLNNLCIIPGMNDFASDYWLPAGEKFETPHFIVTYSDRGVGQASRNMHRWARNYGMRDGNKVRDIVLNSWEGAYFNFDETLIKHMIDDAASMGVETFVLDDGWFGNKYPRNNDKQGLGDWQINRAKLPGGIQALIDHATAKGLKFGIWVEPEMINPRSELAEKHPEWIIGGQGRQPILWRNQLMLDLSNPEVQQFVYDVVARLLSDHRGISYVKWDANRHIENFWSEYLPADRQSHLWIEYTRGLYKVYDRLAANFPDVVFQACSAGGGRVDYGSLRYHHEFWGSDNTDAWKRIFINWGYSQLFPAMAVGSHVSQTPNHQTHHDTPLKFRFDVSMAQRLGMELQPQNLSDEELQWAREGVAAYKRLREVIQLGDLYRLISPYDEGNRASMMYVNEERSRAVLFAYSFGFHYREDYPRIRLQGLDPTKRYLIREVMPEITKPGRNGRGGGRKRYAFAGEGETFSGDFLMKHGMRVLIRYTYESAVFELTEVKQ